MLSYWWILYLDVENISTMPRGTRFNHVLCSWQSFSLRLNKLFERPSMKYLKFGLTFVLAVLSAWFIISVHAKQNYKLAILSELFWFTTNIVTGGVN